MLPEEGEGSKHLGDPLLVTVTEVVEVFHQEELVVVSLGHGLHHFLININVAALYNNKILT